MSGVKTARAARERRHLRLRQRVSGTASRPRLCVFRSLKHIYAQVIDDEAGRTLAAASTREEEAQDGPKRSSARKVGALVAERGKGAGIEKVVFDRGGYKYHGRVKALGEGAREGGLEF